MLVLVTGFRCWSSLLTERCCQPGVDEEGPDLPGVGGGGDKSIEVPDHHDDLHHSVVNAALVPEQQAR